MKTRYLIEVKNSFLNRYYPITKTGFNTYKEAIEFSKDIEKKYRIIEQTRKIKKVS